MPTARPRRRSRGVVPLGALAALATGAALVTATGPAAGAGEPETTEVTVTEGTNFAAAAAPDGSVVIDLHNLLHRVPAGGGEATTFTPVELEPARPDVGPDGRVAFQAYADGQYHIWTSAPDGSDVRQVTDGRYDDREPRWSPDGASIAFTSDRSGSYDVWTVDVATGDLSQWTDTAGQEADPTWHPDGDRIAYTVDNTVAASASGGTATALVTAPETGTLHAPSWAPDGERVAYVHRDGTEADLLVDGAPVTDGQDVFLFPPDWVAPDELLYTADGKVRRIDVGSGGQPQDVPFSATFTLPALDYEKKEHDLDSRKRQDVTGILTPALSPDGRKVAFVALNDLWVMELGRRPQKVTDDDFYEVDPTWSRDGGKLVYSSDREGTEDVYVRDLASGQEQRVTALDGAEVGAALSPDGTRLVFQDQDGVTYLTDLGSSEVTELVPALFGPGRPSWSADGSTVALAAVVRYSERFREGTSQILTVDVATGEQTFHPPGEEHTSLSTRGDDGPVWSPDGRWMAFVVNSTLRVMPVDANGTPTGPAREVNGDVADAPSWSGDSSRLLYLSNGELKVADVATGDASTVDVTLSYRPDRERGLKVIHAGAFWDGESRELRRDVDIYVVGERIRMIRPHRGSHHGAHHVDASGLTVMPGLWDAHVHQELASRFFGDRQGRLSLSYGVTSTLSVGDQVYRAMEDRESLEAGERVGPRFFATGEPIDGSRVYYNFMRPTTSDEQVQLELSRARALDYDMIKTYVRLPADRMKVVIDAAHELGVPSESHYMAPGALLGQDGTTHLAATQRLGFARTITATGHTYDDVPAIYGGGGRSVTTTLFTQDFLIGSELAADPRMALLPPWERQDLLEGTAGNTAPPSDPDCVTAPCMEAQTLDRIRQAGGRVMVGTDSPLDNVAIGVHANLREMVGYGWDPYDALRAAIVEPAEFLGVDDDLGTLERGKVADLIMVEGNPLEDINTLANVRMTMSEGELHTTESLLEPFSGNGPSGSAAPSGSADDAVVQDVASGTAVAQPATTVSRRVDPAVSQRYWWHAPEVVAAEREHTCDAYEDLSHRHAAAARSAAHP